MPTPLDLADLKERATRGDKPIDPTEVLELIERYQVLARQAATLYGLVTVEVEGARSLLSPEGEEDRGDLYVAGRCGAYDFVLTAMRDREWHERLRDVLSVG